MMTHVQVVSKFHFFSFVLIDDLINLALNPLSESYFYFMHEVAKPYFLLPCYNPLFFHGTLYILDSEWL